MSPDGRQILSEVIHRVIREESLAIYAEKYIYLWLIQKKKKYYISFETIRQYKCIFNEYMQVY